VHFDRVAAGTPLTTIWNKMMTKGESHQCSYFQAIGDDVAIETPGFASESVKLLRSQQDFGG